jgi:fatty-acyl-CoA synthase
MKKKKKKKRSEMIRIARRKSSTLGAFFRDRLSAYEHKDALMSPHQYYEQEPLRFTWQQLSKQVSALSCGLLDARLRSGDNIAGMLPSYNSESLILQWAAARAGCAVHHGQNSPLCGDQEIARLLDSCDARIAMMEAKVGRENRLEALQRVVVEYQDWRRGDPMRSRRFPSLKNVVQTGSTSLPGTVRLIDTFLGEPLPDPLVKIEARLTPQSTLAAHYAVADDGEPSLLSHGAVVGNAIAFAKRAGFTGDDRVLLTLPLNTAAGHTAALAALAPLGVAVLSAADTSGAALDVDAMIANIGRQRCTVLVAAPSTLRAVVESAVVARTDTSSLRSVQIVASAADAADDELVASVKAALPSAAERVDIAHSVERTAGFVLHGGQPLDGLQVRLVDANGKENSAGGQLLVKGSAVAHQSPRVDAQQWLHTGEQATRTNSGFQIE